MSKEKDPSRRHFKNHRHFAFFAFVMLFVCMTMVMGAVDFALPDHVSLINASTHPGEYFEQSIRASDIKSGISAKIINATLLENPGIKDAHEDSAFVNVTATVAGVSVKQIGVTVHNPKSLIPCGNIFGVKFFTKGVLIVGTSDIETAEGKINPAGKAGLRKADTILNINGIEVNTVEDAANLIESAAGSVLSIDFERDGQIYQTSLIPVLSVAESGSKYKSGLWIRDSTAGIGTITYYDPQTGKFAGLGHGICDIDTGKLMPLLRATVVDITLTDIIKGEKGRPGELKGSFGSFSKGSLSSNTLLGVFGNLNESPYSAENSAEPLPVALSDEIKEGEAQIISAVGGSPQKYTISISKIYKNDGTNKNFVFEVTDKNLISLTGGIVQGMSGSPIIQNGKLIGAVTHVMVDDPTKGYGVFIENMLAEAEKN